MADTVLYVKDAKTGQLTPIDNRTTTNSVDPAAKRQAVAAPDVEAKLDTLNGRTPDLSGTSGEDAGTGGGTPDMTGKRLLGWYCFANGGLATVTVGGVVHTIRSGNERSVSYSVPKAVGTAIVFSATADWGIEYLA